MPLRHRHSRLRAPRWGVAVAVMAMASLPASAAWSAAPPSLWERVDLESRDGHDGLSNSTAFDLIQDHSGYLWIGGNDGLVRYDGSAAAIFRHLPDDATSLSNNTVRRLLEDRDQRLWVRTAVGLDRYQSSSNQFRHYPIQAQQLLEDRFGLLVASHTGLHRYDPVADAFQTLTPFPLAGQDSPSPSDPVWGLFQSRAGVIWLSTQAGHLFWWSPGGTVRHRRLPWRGLVILHEDPKGRLWIGHDSGIAVIDPIDPSDPSDPRIIDHEPFRRLDGAIITARHDLGDGVWLGGTGLYRTDDRGTSVTPIGIGNDPLALPIRSILVDREGLTWLATPHGLRFHSPYAKRWLHIGGAATNPGAAMTLGGDAVMAVARGPEHQLWLGTLDGGVDGVSYDTDDNVVVARQSAAPEMPCPDQVWALLRDTVERLWVGSGHGLCVNVAGHQRRISLAQAATTAAEPTVFALQQDATGALWVGTSGGLFRVDHQTLIGRRFDAIDSGRSGTGTIAGLLVSADGWVWVATAGGDVYRIDPTTLGVHFFALGDSPKFRGSEGFWALADVGDGRLWLGSDRGLFLFDPTSGSLAALADDHGMLTVAVYAILRDERGSLWLSTRNGLLRHDNPLSVSPGAAWIRHYTSDDGLPFDEFNRRAAVAGPDGWLTFGGMAGIVRFRPSEFRDNPHAPSVLVTAIERYRFDGPPQRRQPVDGVASLAVADAGFAVHFTALTYVDARRAQLFYKMEGIDSDWVLANTDRRARYPALGPGRYAFHVRAANADGVWNRQGATVSILVPTPWWATSWFRLGLGLIGLGALVATLHRIATGSLRRRVSALELDQRVRAERERISRDLHDNVGAQVSTLLAAVELVGMKASRGDLVHLQSDLADLHDDAQHTLSQLRETVSSLRQERICLRDLIGQVQDDLHSRQRVLPKPMLRCRAAGDLSITLGSVQARHLFRVIQEAVSNAIRHANATEVLVVVRSDAETGVLVSICDDGVFQPAALDHDGYGLTSMRSRVAEIGARLSLQGTANGTTIEVVLPGKLT